MLGKLMGRSCEFIKRKHDVCLSLLSVLVLNTMTSLVGKELVYVS